MGVFSNEISRVKLKGGDHIYSWRKGYLFAHHGIYISDEMVIHYTQGGGREVGTRTTSNCTTFCSSSGTRTTSNRTIFNSSSSHFPYNIPCPLCGDISNRPDGVILSCLDCFLSGGDLYLFEYGVSYAFFFAKIRGGTCTLASSDSIEDVIFRAFFLLKKGFGVYDVFKNNCEDFAIFCKTGLIDDSTHSIGRSGQVATFMSARIPIVSPIRFFAFGYTGLRVVTDCGLYCISRYAHDMAVRRNVVKISVEELVAKARERKVLEEAKGAPMDKKD